MGGHEIQPIRARQCTKAKTNLCLAVTQGGGQLFFCAGANGQGVQIITTQTVGVEQCIEQTLAGGAVLPQNDPSAFQILKPRDVRGAGCQQQAALPVGNLIEDHRCFAHRVAQGLSVEAFRFVDMQGRRLCAALRETIQPVERPIIVSRKPRAAFPQSPVQQGIVATCHDRRQGWFDDIGARA